MVQNFSISEQIVDDVLGVNAPLKSPGAVWAFFINTTLQSKHISELTKYLSADELERAKSMPPKSKESHVVTRVLLKTVLDHFLDAKEIIIKFADSGKPYLPDCPVQFSVSHSGSWGGVVISEWPVGIDIEKFRVLENKEALAQRFFSPEEFKIIKESSDPNLFFRFWTAKEAFVKASGIPLAKSLRETKLSFDGHKNLSLSQNETSGHSWQLHESKLITNYAATIACKNPI